MDLDELIQGHLDDTLTKEERDDLNRRLASDPEARRRLHREAGDVVEMTRALGRELPEPSRGTGRAAPRSFRTPWIVMGVAATVMAVWALFFLNPAPERPENNRTDLSEIRTDGTLTPVDDLTSNDCIAEANYVLHLKSCRVAFKSRTVLSLGDIKDGRRSIHMKYGHAIFQVDDKSKGIRVHTPAGVLEDIGTRFEVELKSPRETRDLVTSIKNDTLRVSAAARVLEGEVLLIQEDGKKKLTPELGKVALSADASIGKINDREGSAHIKGVSADRWRVAEPNLKLEYGDWVKAGARGANALALTLNGGRKLILGPGAMVELASADEIRIIHGEVEVTAGESDIKVNAASCRKGETKVFRKGKAVAHTPKWLTGYKSDGSTEALGSLLASVDGRDVALNIGYHKVTVDIRDQIARTTIEESFVNTTSSVLEGVFYFPLPQDASISEFGMWIGNELVHGDIVEKERAREIYETILRERRDPGLLEWTGSSIFKARVFPIGAEKRIKIQYTEVLPKTGDTFRYHYPLRSEMLQLHPLKKLQLKVTVSSKEEIASVDCTSHEGRVRTTKNSASFEFEAEEYTPTRDLEFKVTTKPSEERITFLPHKRAEDGYFMMLVRGPEHAAKQERKPLRLVLMADTSGSMSGPQREEQLKFIDAFLSSLSEKDTFTLVTCDTEARWAFAKPVAATDENRNQAVAFVEGRHPLGWSNLDEAFTQVLDLMTADTQVIYIGDGATTTGDADPVAFGRRLKRKYSEGTFHAVAPGTTYESMSLNAIASMGGGSLRVISDPAKDADRLLAQIVTPGFRNLSVEFGGFTVAAVYPESLPNLVPGTQQIVVGRYDTKKDATGKVTIRGTLNDKEVTYHGDVALDAANKGNSFIPRLWARAHLDHLLNQGRTAAIKTRIITLSEDFQIMTPYTSFLVLESDADREEFKVTKRMRMRDGEEFFQEGRDQANFELARQQMIKAKRWRQGLRTRILRHLAGMARNSMTTYFSTKAGYGYDGPSGGASFALEETKKSVDSLMEKEKSGERDENFDGEDGGDANEPAADPEMDEELEKLQDFAEKRSESAPKNAKRPAEAPAPSREQWRGDEMNFFRKPAAAKDGKRIGGKKMLRSRGGGGRSNNQGGQVRHTLYDIFPRLDGWGEAPETPDWAKDVKELIAKINRRNLIATLPGALRIETSTVTKYDRWDTSVRTAREYVLSQNGWSITPTGKDGEAVSVEWCVDGQRGIVETAWRLAVVRKSGEKEEAGYPAPFGYYFENFGGYAGYEAAIDGNELVLTHTESKQKTVLVIDAEKSAVTEVRQPNGAKVLYSKFISAGGAEWPTRIEYFDAKGEPTSAFDVKIDKAEKVEKPDLADAIVLAEEPKLDAAKQAVKDDKAGFMDRWTLLAHYASTQQWDKAEPHIDVIHDLTVDKWGGRRLNTQILHLSRKLEDLKQRLKDTARTLAATERDGGLTCARDLIAYARTYFTGAEQMDIVKTLKAVFDRRTANPGIELEYDNNVLQSWIAMGRSDQTHDLRRTLAEKYPFDLNSQTAYASSLASREGHQAALTFLKDAETRYAKWTKAELGNLRGTASSLLYNARDFEAFLKYVDQWGEAGELQFNRYLTATIMLDRVPKARELMNEWLDRKTADDRVRAALAHARGQGYDMYHSRLDMEEIDMLVRKIRDWKSDEKFSQLIYSFIGDWRFTRYDEARLIIGELFAELEAGIETLEPKRVWDLYHWSRGRHNPPKGWKPIVDVLFQRWEKTRDERFSRIVLASGTHDQKVTIHRVQKNWDALFSLMSTGDWTEEKEKELLGLLAKFEGDTAVMKLHTLFTWLPKARATAAVKKLSTELTRRELAREVKKALVESRRATVKILQGLDIQGLRRWAKADELYYRVKLHDDDLAVREEAYTELKSLLEIEEITVADHVMALRMAVTLLHLATLKEDAKILDLLKSQDGKNELLDWKSLVFAHLVSLDKGDEVEATLKSWYDQDKAATVKWGRTYAWILAERNRIDEAVTVLESVEKVDDLTHEDYRRMADWYMVQDLRDKQREAWIKSWQAMSQWQISNALDRVRYKFERTGDDIPSEMGPEVPLQIIALLRKARSPQNYVWQLQRLYEATRDFRVLAAVAEAVPGQTSQRIYPFLTRLRQLTDKLQEEATLDRLLTQIADLRKRARNPVDHRALDLLTFMVQRSAAKQRQGAVLHIEAALKALRSADLGKYSDAEGEAYARFLSDLGRLAPALAVEQLRQIRELHDAAKEGTQARFNIGADYAQALYSNQRHTDAIRLLGSALDEYRQTHKGLLPRHVNGQLDRYSSWLERAGEWMKAEVVWTSELERNHNASQKWWLEQRRVQFYTRAISNRREVALGSGVELYRKVRDELQEKVVDRSNEGRASSYISLLSSLWQTSNKAGIGEAAGDATDFAFETLPGILGMYQYRNGQSMVSNMGSALRELVDHTTALRFLVVRAENEPKWLRLKNEDFWNRHAWALASYRQKAKVDAQLEARLLAIVLKELRLDLESRQSRNRYMYYNNYSHFWKGHASTFSKEALAILKKNRKREASVVYIASYLFHGLDRYDAAIDAMFDADKLGILGWSSKDTLCQWLHQRHRWKESIPYLVGLVEMHPDSFGYRTRLMRAYHNTGEKALVLSTWEAADKYFHEKDRWNESLMSQFGAITLETQMYEKSEKYWTEAIAVRVKTARNRGVGDGTLSYYYREAAACYSGMGLTDKAVDHAAAAVVSWGRNRRQRQDELNRLNGVLAKAEDLEEYIIRFEKDIAETGQENPIIRKALGFVLFDKQKYQSAVAQLKIALEYQPYDLETMKRLVEAHDQLGEGAEAVQVLLHTAEVSGHNLQVYEELGNRWEKMGDTKEAYRAFTNTVEMLPNEAASHRFYAKLMEGKERWAEAETHWRQVIRIRTKEPGGYVGLARVLIEQGKKDEAKKNLDRILGGAGWPARFKEIVEEAQRLNEKLQ